MARDGGPGWYLKEWRKKRGWNQEKFAERVEMSVGYVSDLESGKRRYNQDVLERFAKEFNIRPGDLINVNPLAPDPAAVFYSIWERVPVAERKLAAKLLEQLAQPDKATGTDD